MKKQTNPKYLGVLAQKIEAPSSIGIFHVISDRGREGAIAHERIKKLPYLFAQFGVPFPKEKPAWTEWQELLLRIAIAHVPGFQLTTRKRGRPKTIGLDWDLFARVRLLEIERGLTAAGACNVLAKRWKQDKSGRPLSAATLRKRYTAAKAKAANMFAGAAAYEGKSEVEMLRHYVAQLP